METHADTTEQARRRMVQAGRRPGSAQLTVAETLAVGWGAGLVGGLGMAVPLVVWDWARSSHLALELPAAMTAWLFGLGHFSHDTYRFWPIVVGFAFLGVFWVASGVAFAGLADRVYGIATLGKGLAAGAAWAFLSYMLFWYMLLPVARDGAPFRSSPAAPGLFAAPDWVWVVAFVALGLATGACYAALRAPAPSTADDAAGDGRR